MKQIRLIFSLILFCVLPQLSLAAEVVFQKSCVVKNDSILLSDIARFSTDESPLLKALKSQIVTSSPDPGTVKTIDAREVISQLIKKNHGNLAGITWKGSPLVAVSRESKTISSEQVLEIISDFIDQNRHRLPDAEITFIPDTIPLPFEIQTGMLSWEVVPSSPDIVGSSRFSIIFKVDNKVRKNFSVRGRTEAIADTVVAARKIKYGEVITADMVAQARKDISATKNYARIPVEVLGSVAKRTIHQGTIMSSDSIELPPVIKRGEFVKITVNRGGLKLSATGIARSDGQLNEVIRVKNAQSNKLIYCRVQAPGHVEVQL